MVLAALVDIDQISHMKGKSTDTNLCRLFTHLQVSHKVMGTRAVVSLNMAKAFDSVDWGNMKAVLKRMGFGPQYCKWVSPLYSEPLMTLKIGSLISPFFNVGKETRQGCPLLPFLFSLMI